MAEELKISVARTDDAELIHGVMKEAYDRLSDKSLYVCDSLEHVMRHINTDGFALKVSNGKDAIVGCLIVRYPGMAPDNLGRDVGLPESDLQCVVHMETAVVLPEYRGHKLQERMLCWAESSIDRDRFRYLLATVSPDNPASFKSLERCGYRVILTKEKYGGLPRRVYLKTIG